MARIRSNVEFGTITDNPLSSGATTVNSAAFASLPAVASPNVLAITLDPLATAGAPEVVWVTAHTASATSATVLRGQEQADGGGANRSHASGTAWVHSPTVLDLLNESPADVTVTGSPLTGTWKVGQRYQDGQGVIWACIVAGTPGHWICASSGATIDYAENVSGIQVTSTTVLAGLATAPEVGLNVTPYCTGVDPIDLELQASLQQATTSGSINAALSVFDVTGGATPAAGNELIRMVTNPNVAGGTSQRVSRRFTPPVGIRSYKALLWTGSAAVVSQMTPSVLSPAWLKVNWA